MTEFLLGLLLGVLLGFGMALVGVSRGNIKKISEPSVVEQVKEP